MRRAKLTVRDVCDGPGPLGLIVFNESRLGSARCDAELQLMEGWLAAVRVAHEEQRPQPWPKLAEEQENNGSEQ